MDCLQERTTVTRAKRPSDVQPHGPREATGPSIAQDSSSGIHAKRIPSSVRAQTTARSLR